jgi:glutathione S-transferase
MIVLLLFCIAQVSLSLHTLFDAPISNHGARVRLLIYAKNIKQEFNIVSPGTLGGLKSPDYLKMNPQGKMPVLMTNDGLTVIESDTICRYIIETFPNEPSFVPKHLHLKYLSETISRTHDIYIAPVQGSMYKAKGVPFSIYGNDRKTALTELKRQLLSLDQTIAVFREKHSNLSCGPFLCGSEMSLADATLFPTMVFADFILPQFFKCHQEEYMGPLLSEWWSFMCNEVECASVVRSEMLNGLNEWKSTGRFVPIMEEMSIA